MNNPVCEMDKAVNKLRLKYRTYIVEYDVEVGVVMLPSKFANDFSDKINRFVKLIDPKDNHFEVLVENINGSFFLTKGWKAPMIFTVSAHNLYEGVWVRIGSNQTLYVTVITNWACYLFHGCCLKDLCWRISVFCCHPIVVCVLFYLFFSFKFWCFNFGRCQCNEASNFLFNINHLIKSFGNEMSFVLCYNPVQHFNCLI